MAISWRIFYGLRLIRRPLVRIKFVIEGEDWAIRRVGESLEGKIAGFAPNFFDITTRPYNSTQQVVHFGSQYMWVDWAGCLSNSNKYVVSFFHGKLEDGPQVKKHIHDFLSTIHKISRIVVSSTIVRDRLVEWGVPSEKIVLIPIGVDTNLFAPVNLKKKQAIRRLLRVPKDSIVIGSFQKDGVGWGHGDTPKLIKGPDLFVDALIRLKEMGLPVMALLTGPARGYVTNRLEAAGIQFIHKYVEEYADLPSLYQALDVYMITSREEGGPMGLMESMASGIPVVSTRVGMAPDLIQDRVSGVLVNVDDVDALTSGVVWLMDNKKITSVSSAARERVMGVDWEYVAKDHWTKIYKPMIQEDFIKK